MTATQLLKKYYGYTEFRQGQETLIDAILEGQDVLGVMPTGAGKSICFQIPALMMEGVTLVVSPLISLMKDQVGALVQAGIPAAYLNSSLSLRQLELAHQRAREGRYKIIYVAPERLLSPSFLEVVSHLTIDMITVDEAHCISQSGRTSLTSWYSGASDWPSPMGYHPSSSSPTAHWWICASTSPPPAVSFWISTVWASGRRSSTASCSWRRLPCTAVTTQS